MVNAILAKRVNHIVTKGDNPAWPKGSKSRGFSTNPNNNFLKTEAKLNEFASFTREVLDKIKASSAYNEILVHMAMPVACAFMLGHVWMPKADMKLILHDYYNNTENRAIIIE